MKLRHFFLPHPETHRKAHLISVQALLVYVALFIILQVGLKGLNHFKPGVLGITSTIDQHSLIDLTNTQRAKNSLPALKENPALDAAAFAKAQNMFAENYWAHYSPSGKDPWGFINGAGYKFSYAGENLARNFYSSPDVVDAWMASPSHRANIVNTHYQDIGIAVVDGVLQGQQTTLVVQEFGSPVEALAQAPEVKTPAPAAVTSEQNNLTTLAVSGSQNSTKALFDPYKITKTFGGGIIILIMVLLLLDLYILRRRAVHRIGARHLSHLALLSVAASALFTMHPGGIL